MPRLSLRTRLVAGLAAVAIVLIAAAWAITATTRSHLVDQLDDQLIATSDPNRDGRFDDAVGLADHPPPPAGDLAVIERPERLSSMFEGVLSHDGALQVIFEPNLPGQSFSLPIVDGETAVAAGGSPFTAEAVDGDVRYRVLAAPMADGFFVRALPMADVDETVNRLILFEIVGLGAVLLVLAAVAWWVIRLGIRPINAMTRAAAEITDGDLSRRVPEPPAAGTEAGALARALNVMLERIESAVGERRRSEDRLRRFVADASHELRTPVTTIRGYAELYRHGGLRGDGELDDALQRTEQEAERMGRLVEDMLTLAKLDQDRVERRDLLDLSQLTNAVVSDARITATGHRLEATIEPHLTVLGDRDRLQEVLVNLIGNATVHTPDDTAVTVGAHRRGDDVIIEVADDGPGIDDEHLQRVTERFYRADPSRSRQRGGSGLGLSIAESTIEAHGGTLSISSEIGNGTTVTLRIPLAG